MDVESGDREGKRGAGGEQAWGGHPCALLFTPLPCPAPPRRAPPSSCGEALPLLWLNLWEELNEPRGGVRPRGSGLLGEREPPGARGVEGHVSTW